MVKERIEYIDLAKGICILLVVHLHIVDVQGYFVDDISYGIIDKLCTCFRMPLYFFLSGIFFKTYGSFLSFLIKKTNRLLIPFVSFLILYWLFGVILSVLGLTREENLTDAKLLFSFISEGVYKGNVIWFLLCLFEVNMMYMLINMAFKGNFKYVALVSILFGVIGYCLYYGGYWDLPAYLDRAIYYLPFFALGEITKRYTSFFKKRSLISEYIILILMLILFFLFHPEFAFLFKENNIFLFYALGLLGTLIVLQLSKIIKKLPIVSVVGRYSIVMLCLHSAILCIISKVLWTFISNVNIVIFVEFFIVVIIVYYVSPLCARYLPYIFAQKDLIKVPTIKSKIQ